MPPNTVVSFDVGTRNFSYCVVRARPFQILAWEVIDTYENGHANSKSNIDEKKVALLKCLEHRRERFQSFLCEGDAVVIEQQPFGRGRGSPTMNILAHVIGTFFLMIAPEPCFPLYTVRQVAARSKLTVDPTAWGGASLCGAVNEPGKSTEGPPEKKRRQMEYEQYKKNKGWSVDACRSIITNRNESLEWRDMFEKSKKKDDLADSFMQALSQLAAPTTVMGTSSSMDNVDRMASQ
jgi:hypothetical protein